MKIIAYKILVPACFILSFLAIFISMNGPSVLTSILCYNSKWQQLLTATWMLIKNVKYIIIHFIRAFLLIESNDTVSLIYIIPSHLFT